MTPARRCREKPHYRLRCIASTHSPLGYYWWITTDKPVGHLRETCGYFSLSSAEAIRRAPR